MKKVFLMFSVLILIFSLSCSKEHDGDCGYVNGHPLHKGSMGGCYYINDNGNKTYVDRSQCHCN